ncbi:Gas vesicle synthesis protein GvpL/GvpF [Pelotomaculum schinkii]|uniref:Gas vesicle synthesis protein GvpL/GvpF n=1 Tax=Pelotomaculum schinkii TaxID=78350 RepID=A0A4Y7REI6_9FIRM|nr:GvpL/GvpF family gas vesicle protein [Pelotomaculum schinkii]TEB07191.1 Gas vesicle synthesis protein GvpL/GvpF [Pelotomaculum schinkii]
MNQRADDGAKEAADRNSPAVKALARLLVKAELERMELEKEIRTAVREIVRLTVQDAVHIVLNEMAQQNNIVESLNQAPAAALEPADDVILTDILQTPDQKQLYRQPQPAAHEPAGLYLYGVAAAETGIELGITGIDGRRVYSLAAAGLCAVVHDCAAEPYRPDNDEQAKEWLFDHQDVLDRAKEKLDTILPFGFNTIIYAADRPPQEVLQEWLSQESKQLQSLLERLKDNEEYAVKILAPEEALKQAALREDPHLQKLQRELEGKPEGARYLYREKLEQAVKEALEDIVEVYFRKVYRALRPLCSDIQVEKIKKTSPGARMVANLSCLVQKNRLQELGVALAKIQQHDGLTVDFTGPWPPYSFVGQLAMPT